MNDAEKILLGRSSNGDQYLALKWANRHGLIAGATGTGKTVTLQILAEGFSRAGVPVFLADIKGDISALSYPGADKDFLKKRAQDIGLENYTGAAFPVIYWDVFGVKGHPVRATLNGIGPLLLSHILDLNETQSGVLNIAFHLAEKENLPLIDLADLRALLSDMADRADQIGRDYGHVAPATLGTIQRRLLEIETQSGGDFFGAPALDIQDFIKVDDQGQGYINILAADRLIQSPRVYAAFLLWMLSELFNRLPEVGDLDKPKIVFFFDEAHLLFERAEKSLLERIEQVVRLIRSKGVGVYFVTQNPTDIPHDVAAQLSNRVQHALRGFTPESQKAVKVAAQTLRENPAFKTADVIGELTVGEALVSVLQGKGEPSVVERTLIRPPCARMGPIDDAERREVMRYSPLAQKYTRSAEIPSAADMLREKESLAKRQETPVNNDRGTKRSSGRSRDTIIDATLKSTARTIGSTIGREIVRAVLKNILGRSR